MRAVKTKLTYFFIVFLAMVLYDAMASIASRLLQVDYSYFAFGSITLFFLAGFLVSWRVGFFMGVLAGMAAGFTEGTVGWTVSYWIGPISSVSIPIANLTPSFITVVVVIGVLLGGSIGTVGSGIASLSKNLLAGRTL